MNRIHSMFGHTASVAGLAGSRIQGIAVPIGSGNVRTDPRGPRAARWKIGQEEYLRLVEYARGPLETNNQITHALCAGLPTVPRR